MSRPSKTTGTPQQSSLSSPNSTDALKNIFINVNGEFQSIDQANISVLDRGFLYGDSLYEVLRTLHGRPLFLKEHLDRLEKSALLWKMDLRSRIPHYSKEILKTLQAFRAHPNTLNQDAYCRFILTRGSGKIGFSLSAILTEPSFVIILLPVTEFHKPIEKGIALNVVSRIRNHPQALDPAMKSGNYLNNLLAYLEAQEQGYEDALLCDAEGFLTEGTTFNIFYAKDKTVVTPPLDVGILDGITRRQVLQISRNLGFDTREVRFPKNRLYEADEVFISSTLRDVFPVSRVDNQKFSIPGPVTLQLRKAYNEFLKTILKGSP